MELQAWLPVQRKEVCISVLIDEWEGKHPFSTGLHRAVAWISEAVRLPLDGSGAIALSGLEY